MTQRSLCSISSTQGNNGKSSSLLDILNSFGSQFIPLVARKGKKKADIPRKQHLEEVITQVFRKTISAKTQVGNLLFPRSFELDQLEI